MRASAHIRLRVSVQRPQTIHAGEIIYLQQRTDKDPINQYALYENAKPATLLGPMVAEDSTKPLKERGGGGGVEPPSEHATPVLVATGAQFTRKNEVQFITIVAYGFGHLSAEKSDLHPPSDITVNEQMYVEYDPNIYRGVICDNTGGSPFCKAIYSVSTAMDRADTDVYLTLGKLFTTPEADRDAVDGEQMPARTEYIEDANRAEAAGATGTALRLDKEAGLSIDDDQLDLTDKNTEQLGQIVGKYGDWKTTTMGQTSPIQGDVTREPDETDKLADLIREYINAGSDQQNITERNPNDDKEFVVAAAKIIRQRQDFIDAVDRTAKATALDTVERQVEETQGKAFPVETIGSIRKPQGPRVKPKRNKTR